MTYVTGHQSSCIPANENDGLVGKVAVNLCGKREKKVSQEAAAGCRASPEAGVPRAHRLGLSPLAPCFAQPQSCARDTAEPRPHFHCSAGGWRQG